MRQNIMVAGRCDLANLFTLWQSGNKERKEESSEDKIHHSKAHPGDLVSPKGPNLLLAHAGITHQRINSLVRLVIH
jgi:hypothetical protein